MSIKILDTFEPAGQFDLARAKDIKYQEEGISVEAKLKQLDNILNAEPEFEYLENTAEYCPVLNCPLLKLDLGEIVNLEFKLTTPIQANCQITIDRRPFGSTGAFTRVREITELGGVKIISLGSSENLSDFEYKITAVDNMGRLAKYSKLNEDGTVTQQEFINFRVIYGGVQLSSSFKNTAKTNIFETNLTSIEYPFTLNYSSNGYRWLFYSVTLADELPASNLSDITWQYLNLGYTEGGKVTPLDRIMLDFSSNRYLTNPFSEPGNYKLHVCGAVSADESIDFATLLTSKIISDPVDILRPNSIGITIIKDLKSNLTDESYLDLIFVPKTNLVSVQGYKEITAVCSITNIEDATFEPRSVTISCTHAEESIWYIGRVPHSETPYTFTITCSAPGATLCEHKIENIYINQSASDGRDYVGGSDDDKSLLFYFDADTQYYNTSDNTWDSIVKDSSGISPYKIQFKKLNKGLGIKNSKSLNSSIEVPVLKLAGDAYGMLTHINKQGQYVPNNPWEVLANYNGSGFTFEAYLRSKCIGTLSAQAISARKDLTGTDIFSEQAQATAEPGFSIGFDTIRADTKQASTKKLPILEDSWQHLVIVVDKEIRTKENLKIKLSDNDNEGMKKSIEDLNPYATLRVYINGVLVHATRITPMVDSTDIVHDAMVTSEDYPLILNGSSMTSISKIIAGATEKIENQGECEIRLLRGYNKGLTSSEVYKNYLNALIIESDRQAVLNRNGAQLTKIYFTKNRTWSDLDQKYWDTKLVKGKKTLNSTFSVINGIKEKYAAGESRGSKDTLVNCTMHYYLNNTWYHEPNVDVYLQGTSSLEYPVKNYQIKVFEVTDGKRKKKKIFPPFKTPEDGWFVKDSVYTLKCDYMEQAHRNNTPTACYYQDHVLKTIIETSSNSPEQANSKYSPPRQIIEDIQYRTESGEVKTFENARPYRDAIDGFPCVVYFNDNGAIEGTDTFDNSPDANILSDNKYIQASDSYAGSYMFNVDKEGAQLGFELGETDEDSAPVISQLQVYDTNGDLQIPVNTSGQDVLLSFNRIPCVSFEGATNDNFSAAAFVPYEFCQIEKNRAAYNEGSRYFDAKGIELLEGYNTTLTDDEEGNNSETRARLSFEEITALLDAGNVIYCEHPKNGKSQMISQAAFEADESEFSSKYDYYKATLEPRYNYADDFVETDPKTGKDVYTNGVDEKVYNELTYSALERVINWVYSASSDLKRFKEEFSNYFSFEYCLAYYLQLTVFTQTDNAGKNAMFDTWGDGRLYPRPYDMDTQMGIDNSGFDTRKPSAELNLDLCPAYISENQKNTGEFGKEHERAATWAATTSSDHERFSFYNTRNSKLWKTFALAFSEDIAKTYNALRSSGVYSVNQICNIVNNMTSNSIGESYYNKDAAIKYLSYQIDVKDDTGNISRVYDSKFASRIQGNRVGRYKQFLEQRLTFLDSIYGTSGSPSTSTIEIRSNVEKHADIGIHVYTPQYIRVATDSGKQASIYVFADPTDTYTLPGSTKVYNGTLLNIKLTGGDKNVLISGAGNIRAINHTEDLNLTKFDLSAATKITDVNLNGARFLTSLVLDNNTYIRELDITGTTKLTEGIKLSGCANLEKVYAADSLIPGLTLSANSNVKILDLNNSGISSLTLNNYSQLSAEGLNLTGCNKLSTLLIENCDSLTSLPLNHLKSLTELRVAGCPYFTSIDLSGLQQLNTLDFAGDIKELNFTNCMGAAFENLNLTGLTKLEKLILTSTSVDGTEQQLGKLYLPKTEDPTLKELNLESAKIDLISWDTTETTSGLYDFTNIKFVQPAKVSFKSNLNVKKVKNLNLRGSLSDLFRSCSNLETLEGCSLASSSSTMQYTFAYCTKLSSIGTADDISTWNLDNVIDTHSIFSDCYKIDYTSISKFIQQMPNVSTLTSFLLSAYNSVGLTGDADHPKTLPADFFKNNKQITSLYQTFYGSGFEAISNYDINGNEVKAWFKDGLEITAEEAENYQNLNVEVEEKSVHLLTPFKSTLTDMTCTFAASKLKYVPHDLFSDCTALTTVAGTFRNCSTLGTITKLNDVPGILTEDFNVFNETNKITSISGMFAGCTALSTPGANSESSLIQFMSPLDQLKTASATFFNCKKLTHVPEGLFAANTALTNIDGIFAFSGVEKLPNNLFILDLSTITSNYVAKHTALTSARGIFANCTKLDGIINKYFFIDTPNITTIGNTDGPCISLLNGIRLCLPGAFANTKIRGFHEEFLAPLSKLTDASMLFFNSGIADANNMSVYNGGGTINTQVTTYPFIPAVAALEEFNIYSSINSSNDKVTYDNYKASINSNFTSSTKIPKVLFNNNRQLKSVAGMFAGNNQITEISKDLFELFRFTDSETDNQNIRLENVSGMFTKCDSLTKGNITTLLQNLGKLTNVSHMFADCTHLTIDPEQENLEQMFMKCSKLKNCRGFLMNTAIEGGVPADLFESCRNTIEDVSYMFAGCKNLNKEIQTGYAIINDPKKVEINYNNYLSNHFESLKDTLNYGSFEEFKAAVIQGDYKNSAILSLTDYLDTYKLVEIQKKGLLSDCINLQKVDHMFSGCENIPGAIPADMFYMSITDKNPKGQNSKISSLAGLFEGCYHLTLAHPTAISQTKLTYEKGSTIAYKTATDELIQKDQVGSGNYFEIYPTVRVLDETVEIDNDNIYLVPDNWLDSLPGLSDVSSLFYHVGTLRSNSEEKRLIKIPDETNPFTYAALKIPNGIFKASKMNLSNLSGAFAFMSNTRKTTLDSEFLRGCEKVTDISDMFMGSQIESLGTQSNMLFQRNGQTKINNAYRAFYGTNLFEPYTVKNNVYTFYFTDEDLDEAFITSLKKTRLADSYAPVLSDKSKFPQLSIVDKKVGGAFYGTYANPYYIKDGDYYKANSVNTVFSDNTKGTLNPLFTSGLSLDIGATSGFKAPNLNWQELFYLNVICN